MQSFFSTFQKNIAHSDNLILAVSGGVDSMVLLDLISNRHPIENIIVAHFDHSLRWIHSDRDSELVDNICKNKNILFEIEKMDIGNMAKDENMNLEAIARRERYKFLEKVRNKYNGKYIVTAHHAVDQTETIIGNIIKWGKIRWLSGMLMISGYLFRPLLSTTKKGILDYAKNNNVEYRNDSSNMDLSYDRNRIRHEVIPVLELLNPSIHDTFWELSEYMQNLGAYITEQVEDWLRNTEIESGKENTFLIKSFRKLSLFAQSEIVSYLYARAQGGSTQWLSSGLIDELIRFIFDPGSYGKKEIKNLHLERRGERIFIL